MKTRASLMRPYDGAEAAVAAGTAGLTGHLASEAWAMTQGKMEWRL